MSAPEKTLELTRETGETFPATVRAFKVKEYPAAFEAWSLEDEAKLVALSAARTDDPKPGEAFMAKDWPTTLTPESYEAAASAMYEVNQSFFAWCGRRLAARGLRTQAVNGIRERGLNQSPNLEHPQA